MAETEAIDPPVPHPTGARPAGGVPASETSSMRNNNQQKRMRGRNNGNRRSQNPLTRVYESNGPDVKVRGTAQHIVEKYQQLARDAQASGDPVAAENYLQHAEHYYRIIAAAQAQFGVQGQPFPRSDDEEYEDDLDDAGSDGPPAYQTREPQGGRDGGQRDGQRDFYRDRPERSERPDRDRQDRPERCLLYTSPSPRD